VDPAQQNLPSPARCSLCGGPNDCAMARVSGARDEPCWCVDRRFPEPLLARARVRDEGAACVCRRCLDLGEQAIALEIPR
jgi:hypothetical protein